MEPKCGLASLRRFARRHHLGAANRIDDQVRRKEISFARSALHEQVTRIQKEQDGSVIWDEAAMAARANDGPWLEENLVEWIGEYGHEYIYRLNPKNEPIRAAVSRKPQAGMEAIHGRKDTVHRPAVREAGA